MTSVKPCCLHVLSFKAFNLDFYTEVMDLSYLVEHLASDPFFKKFHHLNEKLAEVIQDYGLVSFVPLNVQVSALFLFISPLSQAVANRHWICSLILFLQDKESMMNVLRTVDKANGYCFGDFEERNLQAMMSAAVGADFQFNLYPYLVSCVFCHIYMVALYVNIIIQSLIHHLRYHCVIFLFLVLFAGFGELIY